MRIPEVEVAQGTSLRSDLQRLLQTIVAEHMSTWQHPSKVPAFFATIIKALDPESVNLAYGAHDGRFRPNGIAKVDFEPVPEGFLLPHRVVAYWMWLRRDVRHGSNEWLARRVSFEQGEMTDFETGIYGIRNGIRQGRFSVMSCLLIWPGEFWAWTFFCVVRAED